MKLIAVLSGKTFPIEVTRKNSHYSLTLEGKSFSVDAIRPHQQTLSLLIDGKSYEVGLEKRKEDYSIYFYNDTVELKLFEARKFKAAELVKKPDTAGPLKVVAPMPGKVIKVAVTENSRVTEGDPILVMEAMKMQNELKAPRSGTVKQVHVREGETVFPAQLLVVLE